MRGEKIELGEFFIRGVVEIDRRLVKGIEVALQLLIVGLGELGYGIMDVENNIVQGDIRCQ